MVADINKERVTDEKIEKEVNAFLDTYFYSKPLFKKVVRTKEQRQQYRGCDLVVTIPSCNIEDGIVDEKAAIHYVNKKLDTYALEVSFINRGGNPCLGWLTSPDSITEYYLLQWISAKVNSWKEITRDNITKVEVMLVSKRDIIKFLKSKGLDYNIIISINNFIREGKGIRYMVKGKRCWKFSISKRLAEQPINLILDKWVYRKLAIVHSIVKPKDAGMVEW